MAFDPTYAKRYSQRNIKKISCVIENIPNRVDSIIDIGCNKGYVIRRILKTKKIKSVTGVDFKKSVVSEFLLLDKRFNFIEGDIADIKIEKIYDIVIYLSVHHHIIGVHGIEKSFAVWDEIINHCNNTIFFETGEIKEKGPWLYWKPVIKSFFKTDEKYIESLVSRIGPRLKKVTELKKLRIHKASRTIYKIDLYSMKD